MKKMLMMAVAVVLIVVISVSATFAFLTDTETVVNTFTVGDVDIALNEYIDGSTTSVKSAEIKNIVPGHIYLKKPVVTVKANSEECWVFVKVENELDGVETKTAAETLNGQITSEANGWTALNGVDGVYYKKIEKSAEPQNLTVFEKFVVGGAEVTNAILADYEGKTITVTAYAVQADGFTTAADAWKVAKGADAYERPANP